MRWQVVCDLHGAWNCPDEGYAERLAVKLRRRCPHDHTVRPHPDDVADTDRCPGNTSCGPGCNKPDGPCHAPPYSTRGGAA